MGAIIQDTTMEAIIQDTMAEDTTPGTTMGDTNTGLLMVAMEDRDTTPDTIMEVEVDKYATRTMTVVGARYAPMDTVSTMDNQYYND